MNGNRVFGELRVGAYHFQLTKSSISNPKSYFSAWNIMSNSQMKEVAAVAPTTMDELSQCGLPENIQKTYGDRLIRAVKAYVEMNDLQSYIDNRPKIPS